MIVNIHCMYSFFSVTYIRQSDSKCNNHMKEGAKLNGAVIVDEDTAIYNPGLSLLTASEKERLVDAIIENRKVGLSTQRWSENNEYAFDFLKQKLDPLHMHELAGYLGILPFYGALLYLGALFVQQNARGIFPL